MRGAAREEDCEKKLFSKATPEGRKACLFLGGRKNVKFVWKKKDRRGGKEIVPIHPVEKKKYLLREGEGTYGEARRK